MTERTELRQTAKSYVRLLAQSGMSAQEIALYLVFAIDECDKLEGANDRTRRIVAAMLAAGKKAALDV